MANILTIHRSLTLYCQFYNNTFIQKIELTSKVTEFMIEYDLTVSIVTYKTNMEHIRKSVHDVLSTTNSVFIVLADNNSGIKYLTNLQEEYNREDRVSVISTGKNKGYGYGHNYAFKRCPNSKVHLVMNADIEIDADSLLKMIQYLNEHENIGMLVPKILNPNGSLQPLNKRNPTIVDMFLRFTSGKLKRFDLVKKRLAYYEMQDVGYDTETDVPYASGCFMMFQRKVFEKLGGFDESFFMYLEDADITRRVSEISKVLYYPKAQVVHNWSRGSYKSLKLFLVMLHSIAVYFRKWGWKLC